jgi:hypothetical protein
LIDAQDFTTLESELVELGRYVVERLEADVQAQFRFVVVRRQAASTGAGSGLAPHGHFGSRC